MPPYQAYQPVQQIDIPGLFNTIANLKQSKLAQQHGEMQLADLYEARDRRHQVQAALDAGDMERYAQLDPHGYAQMQKAQLEGVKTQYEIADKQSLIADRARAGEKEKQDRTQVVQQNISRALEANPQAAPMLQQQVDKLAESGHINHFALPGFDSQQQPDMVGPAGTASPTKQEVSTMQGAAGVEDPYAKPTSDQIEYRQAQAQGYQGSLQDWLIAQKKAGASSVSVNTSTGTNSPLTTANETAQQDKLLSTRDSLDALRDVKAMGDPGQFLGGLNAAGNWTLAKLDKYATGALSPEQEQSLGKATIYRQRLEQFFNQYRKIITGAGASVGELNMLKDSVLNSDLSPAQFRAVLGDTITRFERDEQITSNILNRGIPFASDQFRKAFAAARAAGAGGEEAGAAADRALPTAKQVIGKGKNARVENRPSVGPAPRASIQAAADAAVAAGVQGGQVPNTPEAMAAAKAAYIRAHGGGQ